MKTSEIFWQKMQKFLIKKVKTMEETQTKVTIDKLETGDKAYHYEHGYIEVKEVNGRPFYAFQGWDLPEGWEDIDYPQPVDVEESVLED